MTLTIPGNPQPKQRPRVVHGHTYTPKETERAEQWIQMHARRAKWKPLEGPVRLTLRFYRDSAHRCDWDNLAKLCCDALNGIAWDDDSQIEWTTVLKAIDRANPRTEIEVSAMQAEDTDLPDLAYGKG